MSTTLSISFTATSGGITLGGRSFGNPAELAKGADFQRREPCAWAAAQEFLRQGTTAGTVTVTAA